MERILKRNQYEHGGCRIYFECEDGRRELLVDGYVDKEFSDALLKFCEEFFIKPEREIKAEFHPAT